MIGGGRDNSETLKPARVLKLIRFILKLNFLNTPEKVNYNLQCLLKPLILL